MENPSMLPPTVEAFPKASLYVGDLSLVVDEVQLFALFNRVAPVLSVRVCRDRMTGTSLGYGYVNYHTAQDAKLAMELLNSTRILKKPIRIMVVNRDPSMRRSGYGNVFIKNLDPTIDSKALHETFSSFGTVMSCKVVTDNNGQSQGHAFVQFDHEDSAQKAISKLDGMLFNGRKVYVGPFIRRQQRERATGSPKFTNLFIKNLIETTTDDDLVKLFKECGPINSAKVMKDEKGNSRGFGFINFDNSDDCVAAIEKFNGMDYNEKVLYVGKALKKAERQAELKAEREKIGKLENLKRSNLFLRNLDYSFDDEKVRDMFSEFGNIKSCKIMVDSLGKSKGYGFITFSSPEEANRAIIEMNGKMKGSRGALYVAVAQTKEERKAALQAQFAQIRALRHLSPPVPGMGYHPKFGPPQLYFGQGNIPGFFLPQPIPFSYQQQFFPGFQQNFMMPYDLQIKGNFGQPINFRRGGFQQRQLLPPPKGYPYLRYLQEPLYASGKPVVPIDASALASAAPDVPIDASALASATPEKQIKILSNQLYPRVVEQTR